jgi:hypothetical protein
MSSKKAYINIKELPETLQVTDGDYFIVEQLDGTYILDYSNLILEPEKTAISTLVYANQTDIELLSTTMSEQLSALSDAIDASTTSVYIGNATVTIDSGTYNSSFLTPRPSDDVPEITPADFIITPANAAACRFGGYISEVDDSTDNRGFFTITAGFFKTTMIANTATGEVTVSVDDGSTAEDVGYQPSYNVTVIKSY